MRRILFVLFLAFVIPVKANAADSSKQVSIKEYMFEPKELNIAAGTKVTWVNHDQVPHTIVDSGKAFHSAALDTDDAYSFIFAQPGVYHYFCTLHPQMVGTINVAAAQ